MASRSGGKLAGMGGNAGHGTVVFPEEAVPLDHWWSGPWLAAGEMGVPASQGELTLSLMQKAMPVSRQTSMRWRRGKPSRIGGTHETGRGVLVGNLITSLSTNKLAEIETALLFALGMEDFRQ